MYSAQNILFCFSQEADLGASINAVTYARFTAIDFTVPVIYDVTGILIAFPEETSKIMASIQPFSIEVVLILQSYKLTDRAVIIFVKRFGWPSLSPSLCCVLLY
jgi:hypothetical protein